MRSWHRYLLSFALLLVAGQLGFQIATEVGWGRFLNPSSWTEVREQRELFRYLDQHYSLDPDTRKGGVSDRDIDRMLRKVDPYSQYLTPEEYANFEKEATQRYVGIGVQIARVEGLLTVTRVFPDTPAKAAGLAQGDRILEVDGTNVRQASVDVAVRRIVGKPGTPVKLKIAKGGGDVEVQVEMIRSEIYYATIPDVRHLEGGIGYIRIAEFGQRTGREFQDALHRLEAEVPLEGLILDLRNNPGGMLSSAVQVVEPFFEPGELIVELRGEGKAKDESLMARRPRQMVGFPVMVLVNRMSASASEIVAGSLRQSGRAWIVGESSFGKGSIQSIFALSNGRGLRMTTARFVFSDGTMIEDGVGLEPDYRVWMRREEIQRLRFQEVHGAALGPAEFQERFGFEPVKDRQLSAALDLMRREVHSRREVANEVTYP